jgi:predicted nuclease of predicted toxin-antitoxin system
MKVLLDSCVWGGARDVVSAAGHDVAWVGDWEGDPGDTTILGVAHAEARVLITLDKDFGELAILKGAPHAGIVRLSGIRSRDQGPVTVQVLALHQRDLEQQAIVSVEPDRIRIRLPEGRG